MYKDCIILIMDHTIECAIEVLAATATGGHLQLDYQDRTIIKSLARQVKSGIGLTDRQIAVTLNKIEKYRPSLSPTGLQIDNILCNKLTRIPIREIDRSNSVEITKLTQSTELVILIKMQQSVKNQQIWEELEPNILGNVIGKLSRKILRLNDWNLKLIVDHLLPQGFEFDSHVAEFIKVLTEITEDYNAHAPLCEIIDDEIVIANIPIKQCDKILDHLKTHSELDIFKKLAFLKDHGIPAVPMAVEKLFESSGITDQQLAKKILLLNRSRIQIDPTATALSDLIKAIEFLGQFPVLFVMDENKQGLAVLKYAVAALAQFIEHDQINVFFRLTSSHENFDNFLKFVTDNRLNNYIDEKIKAVFISKNRIPKPLIRASWSAKTAIILSENHYGKISSHLNNFSNVYYYNNSLARRCNNLGDFVPIDNL